MPTKHAPSLLLRNINASVNKLTQLYASRQKQVENVEHQLLPHTETPQALLESSSSSSSSLFTRTNTNGQICCTQVNFPPEPMTNSDGENVTRFFCQELDINYTALSEWRRKISQNISNGWGVSRLRGASANKQFHDTNIIEVKSNTPKAAILSTAREEYIHKEQWFIPRAQDVQLVRSACKQLRAVISPLITLSPAARLINTDKEEQQLRQARLLQGQTNITIKFNNSRNYHNRHINNSSNNNVNKSNDDDDGNGNGNSSNNKEWTATSESQYNPPSVRPRTFDECSTFYATRSIPAGVFLLSVPTQAAVFASSHSSENLNNLSPFTISPFRSSESLESISSSSSSSSEIVDDFALRYFMQVEELVAELVAASEDESLSHCIYARYLMENVIPCKNLPFLSESEITHLLRFQCEPVCEVEHTCKRVDHIRHVDVKVPEYQQDKTHVTTINDKDNEWRSSPAWLLWQCFHKEMKSEPLSTYLRNKLTREEYAWWVSLVLSRRSGSSMLIPLMDKLNHSPLPNCYYTMSSEETVCGLDIYDNMLAGVANELLYEPYIHLFSIRDIAAGEPLTLCYCSAHSNMYKTADSHSIHDRVAEYKQHMKSSKVEETKNSEELGSSNQKKVKNDTNHTSFIGSDVIGSNNNSNDNNNVNKSKLHSLQETMHDLFGNTVTSSMLSPRHLSPVQKEIINHNTTNNNGINTIKNNEREWTFWKHPGKQEVDLPDGKALWMLQWGFVPECDSIYSQSDLRQVATLVAERRLDMRQVLFPY